MTLKCPFAAPITAGLAACRNAQEVVRRGGSEYDCRNEADHSGCTALSGDILGYRLGRRGSRRRG
jgi:hypothetical protein